MSDPRGPLTLLMLRALEEAGIPSVYLRNHEKLPADVGNDVDLLVPRGKQDEAAEIIAATAEESGWKSAGKAAFGELALYFANPLTGDSLHIDLYEVFRWKLVDFANAEGVLARRQWNGLVFVPDDRDALYLNIAERLIHHGTIRQPHREAATTAVATLGREAVEAAFQNHIGPKGSRLASDLIDADWQAKPEHRKLARDLAFSRSLRKPSGMISAAVGLLSRLVTRVLTPPGKFVVFEGADGVGKSTVMEQVVPWAERWCAGRTPQAFHWKPAKLSAWPPKAGPSVDPRARTPRSLPMSLAYLAYHWAGFWSGWLLRIYPMLVRSHLVAGDRYSYDLFLDPARFRLSLPAWLCKLAALTVPRPGIVIGLVATPEAVHARKPELSPEEIARYQNGWMMLAEGRAHMATVCADGPVDEVVLKVKQAILSRFTS